MNVTATLQPSSIAVNWSTPIQRADGYVIVYYPENGSNLTKEVDKGEQTRAELCSLIKGQLYTIRVFAYKDLPSPLSAPVHVLYDGEV